MKEVKDGKVPDRAFYYVLDWCDHDRHEFILTQYNKTRVRDLTVKQFFKVMDYIVRIDKNYSHTTIK